jgi:FKBP-type peptidyl-prolyl cis-trans isomerase FklB
MKLSKIMLATALSCAVVGAMASTMQLKTNMDKTSYAMGLETGAAFKSHDTNINVSAFNAGMTASINGTKPLMSKAEVQSTLQAFQKATMKKVEKKMHHLAVKNQAAGKTFLTTNKTKKGVVTLPDGLQYKIIKAGTGTKPTDQDKVTVNYEGTLATTGKVFDSSYRRGEPATFPVSGVIPGWTEALQMMKPGATWMLYIPSDLAYGKRGVPGVIPPNSTLIFKVNLIKIDS